jgi:hypothetical protein
MAQHSRQCGVVCQTSHMLASLRGLCQGVQRQAACLPRRLQLRRLLQDLWQRQWRRVRSTASLIEGIFSIFATKSYSTFIPVRIFRHIIFTNRFRNGIWITCHEMKSPTIHTTQFIRSLYDKKILHSSVAAKCRVPPDFSSYMGRTRERRTWSPYRKYIIF